MPGFLIDGHKWQIIIAILKSYHQRRGTNKLSPTRPVLSAVAAGKAPSNSYTSSWHFSDLIVDFGGASSSDNKSLISLYTLHVIGNHSFMKAS